jgi:hypothetical protein
VTTGDISDSPALDCGHQAHAPLLGAVIEWPGLSVPTGSSVSLQSAPTGGVVSLTFLNPCGAGMQCNGVTVTAPSDIQFAASAGFHKRETPAECQPLG